MDFSRFDQRHYPTVPTREGYGAWAPTYEDTVLDVMDLRLLERLRTVPWSNIEAAADLGCGTGRIGRWLRRQGVAAVDGIDLTAEMLEQARAKGVYRGLYLSDLAGTPLASGQYGLVTISLVDEHLAELGPLYREAARLARPGGWFVLVGYHPFFLFSGVPTHFDKAPGEPVAIESYIHLTSDHIQAGLAAGLTLREMHEGLVDEDWLRQKPKWSHYLHRPVSFAMAWSQSPPRPAT